MTLLLLLRPVHVSLLETARRLAGAKQTGPAVAVAQTALEVELEGALSGLLSSASIPPAIVEWITGQDVRGLSYSPRRSRLQRLWTALTGDALQQAPAWPRYRAGLAARDGFVHSGKSVKKDQADLFIEDVNSLIEHVARVAAAK